MELTWSWVLRRSMGAVTLRETASASPAAKANVLHTAKPDACSGNSMGIARLSPTSKTCRPTTTIFLRVQMRHHVYDCAITHTEVDCSCLRDYAHLCFRWSVASSVTWPQSLTRLCFQEDTSSPMLSTGLRMTWCRNSVQSTVIELSLSILVFTKTSATENT